MTYSVAKSGFPIGEMVTELKRQDNGHYVYESTTLPTGIIAVFVKDVLTERTEMQITTNGIKPVRFIYKQEGGKKKRNVNLHFDWDKKLVTNVINGKPWDMKLPVGTLDKQVYRYALMRDLQKGKTRMTYPIADGGRIKNYEFSVVDRKKMRTDLGTFDTVVVKRDRKDKPPLFMWCAPKLGYLPVKVQQVKKKQGKITLTIKQVEGFGVSLQKKEAAK